MKIRDLGERKWKDFMGTNPSFRVGDIFVYRSGGPGFDYDGYTVAVYECYDETIGAGDICRKGIFWDKQLALKFANLLLEGVNVLDELCQIMFDPENQPPQITIQEAWERYLKYRNKVGKKK